MDDCSPTKGERLNVDGNGAGGVEQTLSDRDQQAWDDQQAWEEIRPAPDGSVDHRGDLGAHAAITAVRARTSRERVETAGVRDARADERDLSAMQRDERSIQRDQNAQERDQETADAAAREALSARDTVGVEELRARTRASRERAERDRTLRARDRVQAARDRELAARDREQARQDREHAAHDRARAGTDELTGARRRGVGLDELENEMKRARREGKSLVAAFVDVDGLKAINDGQGHAAGDELLRTVAEGLRQHMRSYDLLMRLGGDEFLCALPGVTADQARRRLGDLRSHLERSASSTVSIGFSELRAGDSAEEFVGRADADLLASRNGSPASPGIRSSGPR